MHDTIQCVETFMTVICRVRS